MTVKAAIDTQTLNEEMARQDSQRTESGYCVPRDQVDDLIEEMRRQPEGKAFLEFMAERGFLRREEQRVAASDEPKAEQREANASGQQETLGGMLIPPSIARKLREEIERQKAGGSPYFLVQKVQGYKLWLTGPTLQAVLPDDGTGGRRVT